MERKLYLVKSEESTIDSQKRYQGRVKWFNNARGFGFVESEEFSNDIFIHFSAIKTQGYKSLNEGDLVEFNLIFGTKGLQAIDLTAQPFSHQAA